jgi:hypothetical protein
MKRRKRAKGISRTLSKSVRKKQWVGRKLPLRGCRVGISVSETEELESLGLSIEHLRDISIELARYLIVNGATILYGGDLRVGGFTELFSELSHQYRLQSDRAPRFTNYFCFPTSVRLTTNDVAEFVKKQVEVKQIAIPQHLGVIDKLKDYKPSASIEDRYVIAECLTDMRTTMATESKARILLGGRQAGYTGYLPGIVEEAYHSLRLNKPIYLLGGYGGATKSIVDVISGAQPEQFTNEYQFATGFLKEFKRACAQKSSVSIDYDYLYKFFQKHSIDSISNQNGLSAEENSVLFESTNIHELVFLVMKGLDRISKIK